jgi:hypothetical protein
VFAIARFQGLVPRKGKRLLAASEGRSVDNVDLGSHACVAYRYPLRYTDPTKVGVLEAIYRHNPQLGIGFDAIRAITGYTLANPVVITSANHGLQTGDTITLSVINQAPGAQGPNAPDVTTIDSDDIVANQQSGVVITGTNFGDTQGDGKVEISRWATYHDPSKEVQTVSAWADTSITLSTVNLNTWFDILPTTLYVWVTPGST